MTIQHRPGSSTRRTTLRAAAQVVVAALCLAPLPAAAEIAAFPGTNGRIAAEFQRDRGFEIVTMEPDGSAFRFLTDNSVLDRQPAWSPDGTKIAFTSNRSGTAEIWVMNADGTGARRVVASPGTDIQPAWSPDGLRLAFARDVSGIGEHDIWIVNAADGSGLTQLTRTGDADESQPVWSPDGSKIAFVTVSLTDFDANLEIYVIDADGSDPVNLTQNPLADDSSPDWSPDGAFIAFDSAPFGEPPRVFTMTANGTLQEELPGTEPGDREPAWSPDGNEIAFAGLIGGEYLAIHRITVGEAGSRAMVHDPAPLGIQERRPDWQPLAATPENRPPAADAGGGGAVECASPQGGAVALDGSRSSDPDSTPGTNDDIVSFEWFLDFGGPQQTLLATGEVATVTLPLGTSVVTLRVTDAAGASATDQAVWTVRDTAPPTISVSVDPSTLWPPNHQMVEVHATVTATDACGSPSVVLAAVTSSEPGSRGRGKDRDDPDIQGASIGQADFDFSLRAERDGNGPGRVYAIFYAARDDAGNSVTASARVVVPHDAGKRKEGPALGKQPGRSSRR